MFTTHLHSDHLFDLFNILWLTPGAFPGSVPTYGTGAASGLPKRFDGKPVALVDPQHPTPGSTDMIASLLGGYAYDMNVRNTETGRSPTTRSCTPPTTSRLRPARAPRPPHTAPAMKPFALFEDDRVRVTTTLVPHRPVFPLYAFRFDTDQGAITFSGDTAYSHNVAELASGSDILVYEVLSLDWFAQHAGTEEGLRARLHEAYESSPHGTARGRQGRGDSFGQARRPQPYRPRRPAGSAGRPRPRGNFSHLSYHVRLACAHHIGLLRAARRPQRCVRSHGPVPRLASTATDIPWRR